MSVKADEIQLTLVKLRMARMIAAMRRKQVVIITMVLVGVFLMSLVAYAGMGTINIEDIHVKRHSDGTISVKLYNNFRIHEATIFINDSNGRHVTDRVGPKRWSEWNGPFKPSVYVEIDGGFGAGCFS